MIPSTADWAVRYIEKYQLALVPIPPGSKAPLHQGWNLPSGYVTDAGEARKRWGDLPGHGIGAVLAPSGLCSIDVDSPDHALPALGDLGVDLGALRKATPTIQGDPSRYRLMFKAPPGAALGRKALTWPARQTGGKPLTLFELRAGDIQDVLPPTVHPGTGKPYNWLVPPNEFPPLPEPLLELWEYWESYRKELEAMCPWANHGFHPETSPRGEGARPNVIAAFNTAHPVEDLLEAHGYTRRGKRWMAPTSSSGLAGVTILDGRAFSHHASDPLADGHTHDAFDVYRILDHGEDARSAVKAAVEDLGMGSTASAKDEPSPGNGAAPGGSCGGSEPVYRRVSDIQPKPIRWLWSGRIARGKVFMLAGHPGLGKSQAIISQAAIVTTGGLWPVDRTRCERGLVIVLSAEDDAEDTIRPRLEAAGADLDRVYILDAIRKPNRDGGLTTRPFNLLTADIERLGALARKLGDVAMIVIDPITAYLGGVDSHKNAEVRGVLAPLAAIATEIGAAIVCVSHLNKAGGPEAMLRVMGSLGFVAAARGAYLVAKDPEDADRRLFLPLKNNLAQDRGGLAFWVRGRNLGNGIETSCVEWGSDPVAITADEALAPVGDPEERSAPDGNVEWLRDFLAKGPVRASEAHEEAEQAGISQKALRTAREKLGIRPYKREYAGGWWWSLEGPEDEDAPKVPTQNNGTSWASSEPEGHLGQRPGEGRGDRSDGPAHHSAGTCPSCAGEGCAWCGGMGRLVDDEPEGARP